MIRMLTCLAALALVAAPASAQQTRPAGTPPVGAPLPQSEPMPAPPPTAAPAPGSEEWLRLRGETYHSAPESAQDPAEVAATARLNEGIVANNEAAEAADAADQIRFETESQRWRDETARAETARVEWEANVAAANAAQAQWDRQRADYEAQLAACRARGGCRTPR